MNSIIQKVITGQALDQLQTKSVFTSVLKGDVSDIEITAMLTAFNFKGITYQEIAGAAQAMLAQSLKLPIPSSVSRSDSCGTGGDGLKTLNISTLAALTCASVGINMVKHGNRSVSSQCGSADILEALGMPIEVSPELASKALETVHFCFLYAPQYHQAVKNVMPVRRALKIRTLFNLLGPIVNPASPQVQLMGVYDPEKCLDVAQALQLVGVKKAMVVNGGGMDEFTIAGSTQVAYLNNGEITSMVLTPEDFGFDCYPVSEIQINGVDDALIRTQSFVKGQGREAEIAAVAINAGALIYLNGHASSLVEGANIAKNAIKQGLLQDVIDSYIKITKQGVLK
jgi:anthranilate phosphoribosyltransferase